jgi:hypothetical protein
MEMVEVDGLQIAYERAGIGPPLVLLHGYVGDDPTTWRRQLDGLCDEFTVVTWDAPGAGRSSDPPEPFGLDGYAHCLAGFLERLGLDTARVDGLRVVPPSLQQIAHSASANSRGYHGVAGHLKVSALANAPTHVPSRPFVRSGRRRDRRPGLMVRARAARERACAVEGRLQRQGAGEGMAPIRPTANAARALVGPVGAGT